MSSSRVLREVSKGLRRILWESFQADPDITGNAIVTSEQDIVFSNPTETARNSAQRLSLWLYQVTENEFLKNQPLNAGGGHTTIRDPPLVLNLFFLITPFAPSREFDLLLLGSTMQTLYDSPIVLLRTPAEEVFEDLRIVLCRLTLEELTRIWEALREPYRLSVCYQVRVTHIDSRRVAQNARVVELAGDYGLVESEPAGR
jgi:Pvc16 N-terminal domain